MSEDQAAVVLDIGSGSCKVGFAREDEPFTFPSVVGHEQQKSDASGTTYDLPDGTTINIGSDVFRCPEALFQPSRLDSSSSGLHESVFASISQCDGNTHKDLYGNIVLCGGSTLFPGFAERMEKEMKALAPEKMNVKIYAKPSRRFSAWIGGSTIGALPSFQQYFVTRQEYEEFGYSVINRKFS